MNINEFKYGINTDTLTEAKTVRVSFDKINWMTIFEREKKDLIVTVSPNNLIQTDTETTYYIWDAENERYIFDDNKINNPILENDGNDTFYIEYEGNGKFTYEENINFNVLNRLSLESNSVEVLFMPNNEDYGDYIFNFNIEESDEYKGYSGSVTCTFIRKTCREYYGGGPSDGIICD